MSNNALDQLNILGLKVFIRDSEEWDQCQSMT